MANYGRERLRVKKRFAALMRGFQEAFYYGDGVDAWLPEIILLPYVSLPWRNDLTWYRIIGPPGSGKSKHLSMLADFEHTYIVDDFTPKSFVSGFRGTDGKDPSKLARMNGKVVIISDESTLMEQRQEDRNQIQSILRRIYDGTFTKSFGNMEKEQKYESRFNLLIGSTPTIDRYFLYNQALGERFLNFRLQIADREELARRAYDNQFSGFEDKCDALKPRVHKFIRRLPGIDQSEIPVDRDVRDYILTTANLVAKIRTHITRDARGQEVTTLPQPEVASRLVKQVSQIATSIAIVEGDASVSKKHAQKAIYFCIGSVIAIVTFILYHIYRFTQEVQGASNKKWFPLQYLVIRTALSRGTVKKVIEDLAIHRVLDIRAGKKQGGRLIEYSLGKVMFERIGDIDLFQNYIPPVQEVIKYKQADRHRPTGTNFKKTRRKRKPK
ncbi:MAG: hypothetical protein FVQ80_11595 [Planctomycetes bacterium]|nr:hypothetical protein [Planctomycetota bacterium]